ncbi:hypothetical protein [Lysobacter sp. GCM10012299]|uniref:hypothetical protein n=1 Tax=Lysobacter sp. GCM10012299 TaxID=3317333 RepID=UPI00360C9688
MNVETDPAAVTAAEPVARREAAPWVTLAWRRMLREPSLPFTAAYVLVSFLGLWANYWFYRGFGLPILEYMQASDYLVAGLRDPMYALLLLFSVLLALLVSWPETFRRDHPERLVELRRRLWGRLVFMDMRGFHWKAWAWHRTRASCWRNRSGPDSCGRTPRAHAGRILCGRYAGGTR